MNIKKLTEELEKFNEYSKEDESNDIYWKAQDEVFQCCDIILKKLNEYRKDGFCTDFFDVILKVTTLLSSQSKVNPVECLDNIQGLADDYVNETDVAEKAWINSTIMDEMQNIRTFERLLKEDL